VTVDQCRGTLIEHLTAGTECTEEPCTSSPEQHELIVACEDVGCRCTGDRHEAPTDLELLARRRLGLPSLHPIQRRAAAVVIEGGDALVVAPTGFGKSAIYELAALVRPGPTVVISPLIALQHDQLMSLRDRSLRATALNSTLNRTDLVRAWNEIERGEIEFIFASPEQLARTEVRDRLAGSRPSLVVVDEAHCVSEWGHDFRPDYLLLGAAIDTLGHPPTLALTATAGPATRDDIAAQLRLRDHVVITAGMDRPNIRLAVRRIHDPGGKPELVAELLRDSTPAIVYVATRRGAEELRDELVRRGVEAEAYHAGVAAGRRDDVQRRFLSGDLSTVVATTAFGMGIDKPDVRLVVHADPPGSLEQYYQEIGRAGRDQLPAAAVMLFRPEDLAVQQHFAVRGGVDPALVDAITAAIDRSPGDLIDRADIGERVDASERRITTVLGRLQESGDVTIENGGDAVRRSDPSNGGDEQVTAVEADAARRQRRTTEVEMVRRYAELRSCRRQFLLGFLGEETEPCDNCDVCASNELADDRTDRAWRNGEPVVHPTFGAGTVAACDGDTVTVLFDAEGYRTLSVRLADEHNLLARGSDEQRS
jgi:ATP-dependent DNA helicase RecQ